MRNYEQFKNRNLMLWCMICVFVQKIFTNNLPAALDKCRKAVYH